MTSNWWRKTPEVETKTRRRKITRKGPRRFRPLLAEILEDRRLLVTVTGTTPSFATSGTLEAGTTSLTIEFSEAVLGGGMASNYQLQSLGADALLGTADDTIVPLSVSYAGTAAALTFSALPESTYRVTVQDAITDAAGHALDGDGNGAVGGVWVQDLVVVPRASSTGEFAPVVTYPSGGSFAMASAVGDFNGDGKSDLAVINNWNGKIGVLLGNGVGGFAPAVSYAAGGTPYSLAVGDFNGDGHSDLAVTIYRTSVSILLGNGAGGFGAATIYSSGGSYSRAVTVGDFNGDGHSDLAVANQWSYNVGILLGNGAGGFAAPVTYNTGDDDVVAVTTGDFNGDGKKDLAVVNHYSSRVGVLLGNGAGGFAAVVTYDTGGANPNSITVGDFNADGRSDLAVANVSSNNVAVLLGNGVGGFAAAVPFACGGLYPGSVTVGDFNADGNSDLAVANRDTANAIVLLGNGAGGFAVVGSYASIYPSSVTVGDFNADGKSDLAVANSEVNNVGILLSSLQSRPGVRELDSPHAVRFGVQAGGFGGGQLVEATGKAFDGAGRLEVAGQTYAPTTAADVLADGDRTVVTPLVTIAGLNVSREITVPNTGNEDFARTVDVFTNPTTSPITTTVRIVGNLGSNAATTVFATSDGDTDLESTDQWIGTDDADGSGTPAVIHYLHGPSGLRPSSVIRTGDNLEWTYDLTVLAGQTVRLAGFTILATSRTAAIAAAGALIDGSGFHGHAADFLTSVELGSIANFGVDVTPPVVSSILRQTPAATPTNADTLVFRITFSEAVANVDTGDFAVNGTTTATVTNVAVVSSSQYDVTVSGGNLASFHGTVGLNLKAGQNITDLTGNALPTIEPTTDEVYTVDNTGPTAFAVTAMRASSTGFEIEFGSSFDAAVLNVTDNQAGALGLPDVTLVGAAQGRIGGSVVLDDSLQKLTFIKTGGPLAPDSYTVRLRSALDGFVTASGVLLDGDNDGTAGGDYVATLTVANSPSNLRVLSISDVVRGPGQQITDGIPLKISDGTGVQAIDLRLTYDPALLQISGGTTSVSGGSVQVNATTPGVVIVVFYGTAPLAAGEVTFVNLQAEVPTANANAIYGAKQILDLSNLVVSDGSDHEFPVQDDDGIHIVAYPADASGNGRVNASDASLVARVPALLDDGFAQFRLADPLLIGDVSGNQRINSSDASMVARFAALLAVPQIPTVPVGVVTSPTTEGPDPKLSIPTDLTAAAGASLTVPLQIASPESLTAPHRLAGANVVIFFDKNVLTADAVTAAGLTSRAGWSLVPNIDNTLGRIVIVAYTTSPLGGTFADLLANLTFTINAAASGGATRLNIVASSGGAFTELLDESDGNLTLIPAPTNAANDAGVDGLLTITTGDSSAPSTTSFARQTPTASVTNADTLVFRATFSEAVANVDTADLAVNGTTTATVTNVAVVSSSQYDVTVSGGNLASFNGPVGLNLKAGQNITDLAGNALPTTEPTTDETYTLDNTAPTSTITFPVDGSTYDATTWTDVITGTAADTGGSGVAAVGVSIKNNTTSKYWDGSGFNATSESYANATLAAGSWSYPLPDSTFTSGANYTVHTAAVDTVANLQLAPTIASFTYSAASFGDVKVLIPQDLVGLPGGTLPVPIRLQVTQPSGFSLGGFVMAIGFDQTKFSVSSVQLGPLLSAWSTPQTNLTFPGQLLITASDGLGTAVLPLHTDMILFTITFAINAAAPDGSSPINIQEQYASSRVSVTDSNLNDLLLEPPPTNASNDSLDGLVTVDGRPPQVITRSPPDHAINVAVDTKLSITFDEPVQPGNGTVVLKKSSDHSLVETIGVSSAAVTIAGATVTIDPSVMLAELTDYYVEVPMGALQDMVGNNFAGILLPTDWNFKTAGLLVSQMTPTATGFTLSLNQPLATAELNLYDGYPATLGPADVRLVGSNTGVVRGSLVLSEGDRRITFIRTGGLRAAGLGLTAAAAGLLPADTYTVTLRSAANGFKDLAENLLDGNADGMPGEDYTTTFTVGAVPANAVTVGLVDVVRGYGQPVNFPANNLTAGLPLAVSDGSRVSALSLTLRYDPALLTVQNFQLAAAVAARGVTSAFSVSSPGTAVLTITAPVGVSLSVTAGALTVGTFTAQVPDTATYAAKHILDITGLQVYDLSTPTRVVLPARDDDAIHVAAFFGDANGGKSYNPADTILVQRILVSLATGLPAYQLADPLLSGDITLNNALGPNDGTAIQRVIIQVPVANVPSLPTGVTPPSTLGLDPRLYIPQDLSGVAGGTVSVPVRVNVTESAGITVGGFVAAIGFDETKFSVSNVQLGPRLVVGARPRPI
ncbi:MAG: FG-GAP-like repeat-containing protein [Planctomycetota bacterium]|nr:FG-GAP-like repeat-containing protein [Planctomycetota bacterium]